MIFGINDRSGSEDDKITRALFAYILRLWHFIWVFTDKTYITGLLNWLPMIQSYSCFLSRILLIALICMD